jgi:hypothetical protein
LRNSAETDYADVVIVARLQSYGFANAMIEVPPWNTIPAFNKLGLESDEESLELDAYSEQLAIAADLLQ